MEFHNKQLLDYALFAFERKELESISINCKSSNIPYIKLHLINNLTIPIIYQNRDLASNDFSILRSKFDNSEDNHMFYRELFHIQY